MTRLWLGAAITLALSAPAAAQERSDFRLRGTLSGGVVVSGDQQAVFDFDLPVFEGELRAGWIAHEVIVLEARLGGGLFLSSSERAPGALVDLSVGAELGGDLGVARAWGSVHLGAGVTGELVRPVLRLALGLDIEATDEVSLGPMIAYGHLFEEDGEEMSDDAAWVTIGLSVTWRDVSRPSPPPVRPTPRRPRPTLPATPAPPPPPPVAPEALMAMLDEAAGLEPRELLVPVLFEFDSTALIACSVGSLRSLRDHLEEHQEIRLLEIEGHADGSGADAYNRDLSERRAEAIRDWLVEHGVDADRLRVRSRGESAPVEANEHEEGREQNRRARFRVVLER